MPVTTQNAATGFTLRDELARILPRQLMPGNVGKFSQVSWPQWYQFRFDFGVDPTWTALTKQRQSIQVDAEAAFLIMAISWKALDSGTAGEKAPLQFDLVDRQARRQFQAEPIPLQCLGKGRLGRPSIFPTPNIVMPSSFLDLTLSSWLPDTVNQATVGNSVFEVNLYGERVRTEDSDKILTAIFG